MTDSDPHTYTDDMTTLEKIKPVGRPTMFTDETRAILLKCFAEGASNVDACAAAGISPAVYYLWMDIGNAIIEDREHDRKPDSPELIASFVKFVDDVKQAKAVQRLKAVQRIIQAGAERWIHRETGTVRYEPPGPITWLHTETGEITFVHPGDDAIWRKSWSGDAWQYDSGQWQAKAWYMERSDPTNWSQRQRHDVTVTQGEIASMTDEQLEAIARGANRENR